MDQESRDANSLLVELDRGLQCMNIGEQSEAVVRFTSLFQRYPLPILINSACLKLAEAFRCGSNFIRVQICEVFERNQSHLNKIYNVDDFFRNIFTVTTSNDPIARSITLLTLGNIASVVSEYKSIHHCISSSLESKVECELNASIACAASYVKQSSEFACNIYPKIVTLIDSSKSSIEVKIRALSVLDHGFYNANDAMNVRTFLIEVIGKSKHRKLICTCLTLSTKISYTSLSHIRPQIEMLLKTFSEDSREVIKLNGLKNLKFLAEKSPHIWESQHVEPLITHLENSSSTNETGGKDHFLSVILSIFCKLLNCKCNFILQQEKTRIFQQCYRLALNTDNIPLRSMAFELLTVMAEEFTYSPPSQLTVDLVVDTFTAIKTFLGDLNPPVKKVTSRDNEQQVEVTSEMIASKPIYRHIVRLSKLNPGYSSRLLKLVFTRLKSKDISLKQLCPFVTELICAIHELTTEAIITPSECWSLIKTRSNEMSDINLINTCVLYFQASRLHSKQNIEDSLVTEVTQKRSLWFGFKVMRQAMRYGHHRIAKLICNQLHEQVTTDTTDFYFKSLGRICSAESLLQRETDNDSNLREALPLYEESMSPLRAAIGRSRTTNFQLQFLWLRIRNLQAHSTLRQCCKVYETSPISYADLLLAIGAIRGSNDPSLSRLGVTQQMPKIAKEFRYLSELYENLSVVSFNCDDRTLDYIHLLKCTCVIMADTIDAIFQYGRNLPVISKLSFESNSRLALEHRELEGTCRRLIEMIEAEILKPGISPSQESIQPLINLLRSFSVEILKCPFVYPRYFFQPLQMTQIKLAITPQPSQFSGSLELMINFNLVLKVEGLIQNPSKTHIVIRKVSKVIVSVRMNSAKLADSNLNLFFESITTPRNSYFKTEFLLPLKWAGLFNIEIDASIIDEQERIWRTGPTEKLSLNVS